MACVWSGWVGACGDQAGVRLAAAAHDSCETGGSAAGRQHRRCSFSAPDRAVVCHRQRRVDGEVDVGHAPVVVVYGVCG